MTTTEQPAAAQPVPEDVAGWRALTGQALVDAMHHATWHAWPDDTIGGWAVMPINVPPSAGAPVVGYLMAETIAREIAAAHNLRLSAAAAVARHRADEQARHDAYLRMISGVRDVIQLGDVVFVPKGVDSLYNINRRFRVDNIRGDGPCGSRVKATGEGVKATGCDSADEHGNLPGYVTWIQLTQCTIYRDGTPVYQPGTN
jgi:hypothetical protein